MNFCESTIRAIADSTSSRIGAVWAARSSKGTCISFRLTDYNRSVNFSLRYREQLLATLGSIDVEKVSQAINWFHQARSEGRAMFVAGNGGSHATASHFVCDMVKGASFGKESRFRIV